MKRSENHRQHRISRASWFGFFGFTALGMAVLLYGAVPALRGTQPAAAQSDVDVVAARHAPDAESSSKPDSPLRVGQRPIESIRVGDRVFASNPEISDAQRASWAEPDWGDWWHLSLEMPLPDADGQGKQPRSEIDAEPQASPADGAADDDDMRLLHIELLRPDSWVRERLAFVVDDSAPSQDSDNSTNDAEVLPSQPPQKSAASPPLVLLAPLHPLFRDLALTSAILDAAELELAALTLDLDLPEMGASGTAIVTNIQPCPAIRPPRSDGDGQVVTATFSHPPSTKVLDVTFVDDRSDEFVTSTSDSLDDSGDSLGVTDNHLFWSVDRQQFSPIGQMEIGERVLTFHGDTKRIVAKLPRPGPQLVYNLEVYGEHVYFVGEDGVLAHNTYAHSNRYLRKATAFERYRANGGTLGRRAWGRKYDALVKARRAKNGPIQNHHLVTNKMRKALNKRGLDGNSLRNRVDLQYNSAPNGHVGYQRWHIDMDDHMVDFINTTKGLDDDVLLREIHRYYQNPDLARHIPGVDLGY